MSQAVSWVLMLKVKDGKLDEFKALADEMVKATEEESGAVTYEWNISDDGSAIHLYERYTDSAATLAHLGNFGANFAGRFFGCVDPTGFYVYGHPDAAAAQALKGAGATIMSEFAGFAR